MGVVGSANLNHRSLQLDEEVDVVLFDAELVAELELHTDVDLGRCEPITPEDLDGAVRRVRTPLRWLTGAIARWT